MKTRLQRFLALVILALAACTLPPRAHAKQFVCEYESNLPAGSAGIVGLLERQTAGGAWVTEPTVVLAPTTSGKTAALRTVQDFAPGTYTFRVVNVRTLDGERSAPSAPATGTVVAPPPQPSGVIIFTATLHADGRWTIGPAA